MNNSGLLFNVHLTAVFWSVGSRFRKPVIIPYNVKIANLFLTEITHLNLIGFFFAGVCAISGFYDKQFFQQRNHLYIFHLQSLL